MTEEEKKLQSPYAVDADALYGRLKSDRPTYAGTYESALQDLYGKITSRPGFAYDVNTDPLFQKYKNQYVQQGKLAMRDTMGQAAALTGGYGSSYGQAVGQQAYDRYLEKLGDVVPELYSQAYSRWNDEGDRLMQQYSMLGAQRDTEYNRYRQELGDWENERSYQYNLQQDNYANLYKLIGSTGYTPTDAELSAAGMSREAANAIQAEYMRQFEPAKSKYVYITMPGTGDTDGEDLDAYKDRLDEEEKKGQKKKVSPSGGNGSGAKSSIKVKD